MPPTTQQKKKSRNVASAARPTSSQASYAGKRTKTGNSYAFRFEGALFKSHPEFSGEVRAHVIAPGRLLVTADPIEDSSDDPVLASFLAFLDRDMLNHPENIRPLDENLLARIASLVEGVEVNMDEDLGDESIL